MVVKPPPTDPPNNNDDDEGGSGAFWWIFFIFLILLIAAFCLRRHYRSTKVHVDYNSLSLEEEKTDDKDNENRRNSSFDSVGGTNHMGIN